jgi:hypothetical protein
MSRPVVRLILDVMLTILVALALLTGFQVLLGGGLAEGARVLFTFMDVGLALWVILLIVWVVRLRPAGPSAARTYLFLLIGVVLNLVVVTVVGFIQGGWGPLLVLFAIEGGIVCLLAAAIVVPIVHRAVKSAQPVVE